MNMDKEIIFYHTLVNLEGVKRKKTKCVFIKDASRIKGLLSRDVAITSADDNGALNIWIDDKGVYRCKSMRYGFILDKKETLDIEEVIQWAEKWIKEIQ